MLSKNQNYKFKIKLIKNNVRQDRKEKASNKRQIQNEFSGKFCQI